MAEEDKYFVVEVNDYMCHKVKPLIKSGDKILVSFKKEDQPNYGKFVLVSLNEKQWIEKYWKGLSKRYQNVYPILRIIIS